MRSLMFWGHTRFARSAFKPLFVYRRPGIELHDGAFKLEDLADYFFVTRDADVDSGARPLWQREIDLILRRAAATAAAEGSVLLRHPHAGAFAQHQR